ncbi:GNAT family N-acetyltransferase [Oceanobacillus chungangensis]|uniref:GNAT family N-acetyltransferase n=1 Tax=Oceanobacillus chungangensis TaxID=1229152 RepID=A0A3D8PYM6_9BACI|nr:GNAT family N-acetyltransferase [Oceanobacillus chungangensis]RDW21270.1 GNAT family N-acetyltransferase [Oceanobacillus chungangensis]
MKLVKVEKRWQSEHEAYVKEWGSARMVPSSFSLSGYDTYEAYLEELEMRQQGIENWVPNSNYFLIDNRNRIVAMVNIRHRLNDYLQNIGGHIGYGVRPSERQKGYATLMLAQALKKCKEQELKRVLVTCDDDNICSAKVILKNGGIEDEPFRDEDGSVIRRFWIEL